MALALAAGAGADYLVEGLARWLSPRRSLLAVSVPLGAYLLGVAWRAHPYPLDYFNELVGGAAAVTRGKTFETAWWGEGLAPALAFVNEHAAPHARVQRCIEPAHLAWFREDLWDPPTNPDWVVVYAPHKQGCSIPAGMRVVFTSAHRGVVYARVYARPLVTSALGQRTGSAVIVTIDVSPVGGAGHIDLRSATLRHLVVRAAGQPVPIRRQSYAGGAFTLELDPVEATTLELAGEIVVTNAEGAVLHEVPVPARVELPRAVTP